MTNTFGIEKDKAENLTGKLNLLLAHYSIFYQNTRGYHWNIKGDKFFELHLKFEELYNDLFLKIDEVAERILTLRYTPESNYSQYIKYSAIKEGNAISNGLLAVEHILNSYKIIIKIKREILLLSTDANDEFTNALMSDYIRFQDKQAWMYSSFLNK